MDSQGKWVSLQTVASFREFICQHQYSGEAGSDVAGAMGMGTVANSSGTCQEHELSKGPRAYHEFIGGPCMGEGNACSNQAPQSIGNVINPGQP